RGRVGGAARRAGALADGARRSMVVALCLARLGRIPGSRARAVSDGDRAALQQVRALGRQRTEGARRATARTLRFPSQGILCDGWLETIRARQRVLHGL